MMIDRNKVIEALERCQNKVSYCEECPYKDIGTADMPCLDRLMRDAQYLLEHEQETPQPVRESTSDFVRFNQGEIVVIINRHYVVDAAYKPSTDETYVCMRDGKPPAKYDGNIIDKITGGE
jgi:hypothetical protein